MEKQQDSTTINSVAKDEDEMIDGEYHKMLDIYMKSSHRKNLEIIEKAYQFAKSAHAGVRRRSGEPYILHPIAVARIVAEEIGLGSTSICSALLHDVVEDTEYTVEDITEHFGKKIAQIVEGLTKISGGLFADQDSKQAENNRKLILTMNEDIRVVLIKMCDRLHNMRTLQSMPPAKQLKIAAETQNIYAPLANRLGLYAIKTELEDLSFKYAEPDKYEMLVNKLEENRKEREDIFASFRNSVSDRLDQTGLKYEIHARVKSVYSIWRKMQTKGITFEDVYDLLAMRIIFDPEDINYEKKLCWEIYSLITDVYKPHPDRIRDWVSIPKSNGYEALHMTVMGPYAQWVEVQIRSRRMDEIAEKGFAAHWKYKTGERDDSELENWLQTIKDLLVNPEPNAIEFLDTFKLNLFNSEIVVFTPKGDRKTMPTGSTVLDFAFSLHTDMGLRCMGAKVSHKLQPISYVLQSGDQVEILTSKKQTLNFDWINIVKTARAKSKIKTIFRKEYRETVKKGETELRKLLGENETNLAQKSIVLQIVEYYKVDQLEDVYYKIGKGLIDASELVKRFFDVGEKSRWIDRLLPKFSSNKDNKAVNNVMPVGKSLSLSEVNITSYRICPTCKPIPGDTVFGFRDDDGSCVVHKNQCPMGERFKSLYGDRIVTVKWEMHKVLTYPATIKITGIDDIGLLGRVINIISNEHEINMSKLNFESVDGIFEGIITLYICDVEDLNNLCMKISAVKGIKSVVRVEMTGKN